MDLKEETKNNISAYFESTLGISYEEFKQLDADKQQELIENYKKKTNRNNSKKVTAMIGSGENTMFIKVNKGERIMIGTGEDSCFVRAGISLEESRRELDDRVDDAIYSKPVAFVKKLQRKVRKNKKM